MNPTTDYKIIYTGCFTEQDFHLEAVPGKRTYKSTTRKLINLSWQEARLDPALNIFNGPVVSLLSILLTRNHLTDRENFFLKVQMTDYKSFYGTNVRNSLTLPKTELANALAVCAVVETKDGTIFTGKRNQNLAETSGYWHVPGGTFDRIANPLQIMKTELFEELNIAESDISQALCLGFAENLIMKKPEFLCYFHLNQTEAQLIEKMVLAPDKDEHTEIAFVPLEELADFVEIHPFAPIGKAAVKLYLDYITCNQI